MGALVVRRETERGQSLPLRLCKRKEQEKVCNIDSMYRLYVH